MTTIEVPSYAEHEATGAYGAAMVDYRGHAWRVEFGKTYTRAFRDGARIDHAAVPVRVKVRAIDAYMNLLKPAFEGKTAEECRLEAGVR